MNRLDHKRIYDDLSIKWQEDKFRRQQEINQIGKPQLADLVLGWLFAIGAVIGIVTILIFINNK